jgi:outer membrane protein assembly factor BamB
MYDAMDGNYILSIVNGTTMTMTEDQGGNLIGYYVNSSTANAYHAPTLNEWNSTQCIIVATNGLDAWQWRPTQNAIIDFRKGIMWSAPLATNISGVPLPSTLALYAINSGVIVMNAPGPTGLTQFQCGFQIEAGYDANTGAQLWITNRTETPFTRLVGSGQNAFFLNGNGVYVVPNLDTFTVTGYSDYTGAQLWTTVLPNANPYDSLLINGIQANGTLYLFGLGGDVYAINMATGAILWKTTTEQISGPSGSDTPYGVWPLWTQGESMTIADGKLYVSEGHEYSPPLFRGAQELCLNITNGQLIWSTLGFNVNGPAAISDGVITVVNGYDNQIYAYGKGPSKVTVAAPSVGVTTSTPVTISGTVTDISAGSQEQAVAANFPNGLPCISDASMSHWMEYVYEQQPMPTNATGVPIVISVVDSNGNYRQIGTATSNTYGTFSLTWTPDIPGDYTIIASFAGSESYYPSSADATMYASTIPTAAPTSQPISLASTQTYIMAGVAAIIIVVVIVGAVLAMLMLRKRP